MQNNLVRGLEETDKKSKDTIWNVNKDGSASGQMLAWLQVLGSFCLYFNTYGVISSFGIYQTYYVSKLGYDSSLASLIGSVQSFLVMFANGIAGPLYDAGYYRHILVVGAAAIVTGTLLQSISKQYWHFVLTQGICVGLGGGLIAFLGPTILATYFQKKLPLASGIGASGGGVAGIIFPIMFRELQPQLGFGWAVRIMAFLSLVTLALPVLTMRVQMKPSKNRRMFDPTVFHDRPFLTMVAGNFLFLLGAFTPFFYIQVFAIDSSLASRELSFYVLATMNLASVVGRILPNFFTAFIGPFNMFICMVLLEAVSAFAYLGVTSLAGLIVTSVVFGFASGGAFALQPVVLIRLCPSPLLIGTRIGMASACLGFALFASNPIAGAILDSHGGYTGVWIWSGVTMGAGGLVMATARGLKSGWSLAQRV
ncbi:putative monocarboxylate permease [Fusarium avenaceum]|nr:putative monocarboxylate permease [Fusarium avenaceum]